MLVHTRWEKSLRRIRHVDMSGTENNDSNTRDEPGYDLDRPGHSPASVWRRRWRSCALTMLCFACWQVSGVAAQPPAAQSSGSPPNLLWQIGQPDGDASEFALAPGNWRDFKKDALFLVGQSDPKVDWPYVHPGPDDDWAGRRRHTFTILFGAEESTGCGVSARCTLAWWIRRRPARPRCKSP